MTADNAAAKAFARRIECEADGMYFNRYFFKERLGSKMIVNAHHHVMQRALERTMLPPWHPDFIPRLIINVPPGYTKTEMAVISYMARGIALNAKARFLHLSYSNKLALLNSTTARAVVKSRAFQDMWPVQTKDDVDSKEVWHTQQQGGVTASTILGQVTGFRAGHMDMPQEYIELYEQGRGHECTLPYEDWEFLGALVVDDPVNPKTATYDPQREQVNEQYNETVASRLAVESVPTIVIMQRVHWSDLSGYLLRGGSGEPWYHLNLPVKIDHKKPYPEEYTHGIPIEHGLPDGWLWPYKHNDAHEEALFAHRRRARSQYMQDPIKRDEETALFTDAAFIKARSKRFKNPIRTVVAVDPAASNNAKSDLHGIGVATRYDDPNHYHLVAGEQVKPPRFTIDADYSRRGTPSQWAQTAIEAYEKHEADAMVIETNQGGDMCEETLRNAGFKGRLVRVHAVKGKTLRAEPVAALYELGHIGHLAGLSELEDEAMDFDPLTGLSNNKSPNRVDWMVYAITELADLDTSFDELLAMAARQ